MPALVPMGHSRTPAYGRKLPVEDSHISLSVEVEYVASEG